MQDQRVEESRGPTQPLRNYSVVLSEALHVQIYDRSEVFKQSSFKDKFSWGVGGLTVSPSRSVSTFIGPFRVLVASVEMETSQFSGRTSVPAIDRSVAGRL